MVIPDELFKKWKALYTPGDAEKMAEKLEGGYAKAFTEALRLQKCNDTVFKVMADFFEEKADLIKEYL